MDVLIDIHGFQGREVFLRIGFIRRPGIVIDGEVIRSVNNRFRLKTNEGKFISVSLKRRFLDPIPRLSIADHTIETLAAHRWYIYAWLLLPILLIALGWWYAQLTGALSGLFWAFVAITVNSKALRLILSGVKYFVNVIILVVCISAGFLSIQTISRITNIDPVAELQAFLADRTIPEIHGNHHAPTGILSNDTLHRYTDDFGYPLPTTDAMSILDDLKSGRFDIVDSLLVRKQRLFEQNYRYEDYVYRAFHRLAVPDSSLEPLFSRWIELKPSSFAARQARAEYYHGLGWACRGTRWASETSAEQFAGMESFFKRAEEDARDALEIEPRLLVAYEMLLDIARTRGETYSASLIMDHAVKLCPYSYRIRYWFMMNLTPRWGGTHEAMEAFARESQGLADVNPRMRALRAFAPWDKGRIAVADSEYDAAGEFYREALSYGDNFVVLDSRARLYWRLNQYEDAKKYFERALAINPYDDETAVNAARMTCYMGRTDESIALTKQAERNFPYSQELRDFKDWEARHFVYEGYKLYEKAAYQDAAKLYDTALAFHETYYQAYYYRALAASRTDKLNSAESDLKEAIRLNPRDFPSYMLMDWVLAKRKEWDKIIDCWSAYIKLVPYDGKAFLERGGAKYQKGDYREALKDADKACRLDVQEGCVQVERLRGMIGK
jgi:tetratricopeptide (TPR) repeat protein